MKTKPVYFFEVEYGDQQKKQLINTLDKTIVELDKVDAGVFGYDFRSELKHFYDKATELLERANENQLK